MISNKYDSLDVSVALNHIFVCLLDTALNPVYTSNVSVMQQQSNSNLKVGCSKGAGLLMQAPESKIY